MPSSSIRVVLVAAALALVVLLLALFWSRSDDENPQASPSSPDDGGYSSAAQPTDGATRTEDLTERTASAEESAEPTVLFGVAPSVEPKEIVTEEPADALVKPLVEARSETLATPKQVDRDTLVTVASDQALDALLASAAEYEERGWSQIGSPVVVSTEVQSIDREAEPPTAALQVCLDYADVDVVDAEGDSVRDAAAATRVSNLFNMEFVQGRWVLVSQTFPDDITC